MIASPIVTGCRETIPGINIDLTIAYGWDNTDDTIIRCFRPKLYIVDIIVKCDFPILHLIGSRCYSLSLRQYIRMLKLNFHGLYQTYNPIVLN